MRPLAVVLALACAAGILTGCNATKRELTVDFSGTATAAQREAALHACTGVAPHTTPEPMPTTGPGSRGPSVRFRIDQASDRDIAHLEGCLQSQPGVVGFEDTNDSM